MRLLCLSNGHGEDAIATRIIHQLLNLPDPPEINALPLVGEGQAYIDAKIPIIGPVKSMPSGGFIYMDGRQLAQDVRGGLLQLAWQQYKTIRAWAKDGGTVLAVGDLVPLLFAWLSGLDYGFVATAKSEYWIRDEAGPLPGSFTQGWSGSVYLPWERWLMGRKKCKAVFPRDRLTAETLQEYSLPIFDLGNPMMDDLQNPATDSDDAGDERRSLCFLLLPGSRTGEAYSNWEILLTAIAQILGEPKPFPILHRPVEFLGAISPGLSIETFGQILESYGWRRSAEPEENATESICYTLGNGTLFLSQNSYAQYLHRADVALAMAGTATEQFVGLGKPAIAIPGSGPQFTPEFARVQAKLLGPSLILVDNPRAVPSTLQEVLQDPDRLQLIYANGRRRMGLPGAAERIALCCQEKFWAIGG
ncbi:lipid-A-disaccharide synthase-related protein [Roseofilum casamattae]|uniref:Lipid-A-disaccharide synthase-related protein n=1 Tax=Roseofilum casamattae BLCC-M143 TaxID=3022442 RepID=A0ABT7BXL5_9CYAN|nr:lipid-A-disaccharide synthase-related protein [Roseofilum casamattae]MDJ1183800.1 lipid-A-disaccharide synthase-related protein [Roseofilum casamattae BLCC-M143]